MNYIVEYQSVLTEEFCNNIIKKFEESEMVPGVTIGGYSPDVKNTYDFPIKCNDDNWTYENDVLCDAINTYLSSYINSFTKYISDDGTVTRISPDETMLTDDKMFNIQVYRKNIGIYKYHNDFLVDNDNSRYRMITYIFYLNNVSEGGETEFWGNYRIKPEIGKLVFFPACWTFPHTGKMPISNDKYIITGWLYKDSIVERLLDGAKGEISIKNNLICIEDISLTEKSKYL